MQKHPLDIQIATTLVIYTMPLHAAPGTPCKRLEQSPIEPIEAHLSQRRALLPGTGTPSSQALYDIENPSSENSYFPLTSFWNTSSRVTHRIHATTVTNVPAFMHAPADTTNGRDEHWVRLKWLLHVVCLRAV